MSEKDEKVSRLKRASQKGKLNINEAMSTFPQPRACPIKRKKRGKTLWYSIISCLD